MPRSDSDERVMEEVSRYTDEATGYTFITYDTWEGERRDPSVEVERRVAIFLPDAEIPNGALAADGRRYSFSGLQGATNDVAPQRLQKADREVQRFKAEQQNLVDPGRYAYGSEKRRGELYIAFLEAIDVLAMDYENEAAWAIVDAYRDDAAMRHEK